MGATSIIKYYSAITESFAKVYGSERFFQLRAVILCHISTKDTLLFNSGCQKSLALYNGTFRALVNGAVDRVEPIFLLGRRSDSPRYMHAQIACPTSIPFVFEKNIAVSLVNNTSSNLVAWTCTEAALSGQLISTFAYSD